ncbi:MAG: serine acetyltransferase [Ekhidna sp.]|nr:serine acetyltransferase [Ekhidna sp.]
MQQEFIDKVYRSHLECTNCPSKKEISSFFEDLLGLLFPNFNSKPIIERQDLANRFSAVQQHLIRLMGSDRERSKAVSEAFFQSLADIYDRLNEDLEALLNGDPAAKSREEVVRSYPGFYAIAAYRIAHELQRLGVGILPRSITEHAHSVTGIDIHPGASIGRRFFIDHGTGVVIGETTVIGDDVKLYQGVTLGALSVEKKMSDVKRHPTIGDKVIIYSGATILGGNTTIGNESTIGGNVWLTSSVAPRSKVYYQSAMSTNSDESMDTIKIKSK